jgi:enoyl-CoA hydratase/carnithine racemase
MPPMSFVEVTTPHPHVALVTLNRPERMNSMAFDVMIPFRDRLREIGHDNEIRVVIITGAGRGFCSGADLENPGAIPHVDGLTLPTIALRSMELLDEVITTIRRLHQPVIAAVNGPAIGGGFCLALSADIRIASDSALFRAAGINNGLTAAELGISFLLPRADGRRGRSDRAGLERRRGRILARDLLRHCRSHHRMEPSRCRADEATALEQPGRVKLAIAHGRGRDCAAVRSHHDPEFRRVGPSPAGETSSRLPRLATAH